MTRVIKYCDACHREVDTLYDFPKFCLMGLKLAECGGGPNELCRSCANKLINAYNSLENIKVELPDDISD